MLSHIGATSCCAMFVEAAKLGVVEAKEIGAGIKGTGSSGQSLQTFGWRQSGKV